MFETYRIESLISETQGDNLLDFGGKEVKKEEFDEEGPFYMRNVNLVAFSY